jgi:hypothetical protein
MRSAAYLHSIPITGETRFAIAGAHEEARLRLDEGRVRVH